MLARANRLNISKSFKFVAAGSKRETPHLKVFYKFGENEDPLVGIALSKKVLAKAVDRNRAKRMISRVVENEFLRLRKNLNLVIMPKEGILECKSSDLVKELVNVKDIFNSD